MIRRWPCIVLAMLCCLLVGPVSALALEAPAWSGSKQHEAKFRQDWYACYSEAQKTVPPVNLQVAGTQSMVTVALALEDRNRAVQDLTMACMAARGYVIPEKAAPVDPPGPKGK